MITFNLEKQSLKDPFRQYLLADLLFSWEIKLQPH